MQQIRRRAQFIRYPANDFCVFLQLSRQLRTLARGTLAQFRQIHDHHCQRLARAIVQFSCDSPPFIVLGLQQSSGQPPYRLFGTFLSGNTCRELVGALTYPIFKLGFCLLKPALVPIPFGYRHGHQQSR